MRVSIVQDPCQESFRNAEQRQELKKAQFRKARVAGFSKCEKMDLQR